MDPTLETRFSGFGTLNRRQGLLNGGISEGTTEVFHGPNLSIMEPLEVYNRGPTPRAMLVRPTIGVAPASWPMGLLVVGRLPYASPSLIPSYPLRWNQGLSLNFWLFLEYAYRHALNVDKTDFISDT